MTDALRVDGELFFEEEGLIEVFDEEVDLACQGAIPFFPVLRGEFTGDI